MAKTIIGPTILLSSGEYFNFERMADSVPTIEDFAYGLGNTCRWSGQTVERATGQRCYYSVAQHCVEMISFFDSTLEPEERNDEYFFNGWELFNGEVKLAILMHELGELPYRDMAGPAKSMITGYREREKEAQAIFLNHYGISAHKLSDSYIKMLDLRMMATERRDLTPWNMEDWWPYIGDVEPFSRVIVPWDPRVSAVAFLKMAERLKRFSKNPGAFNV